MLSEPVKDLLNQQVKKELYSAYLYLHFSNFYTEQGLKGFANWYQIQAQEELDHAMLIVRYLQNNDAAVIFETIERPDVVLREAINPLAAGLAHEKYVTGSIYKICEAALGDKDYRTLQFLDWFVKEQGEEEAAASELVKRMELYGSDPRGLYLLDQELSARTYLPSAPVL